MKKTKEKKIIAPNECSFGRWVLVLVVGLIIGMIPIIPIYELLYGVEKSFMGISYTDIFNIVAFVPLFWGVVISIRVIGKTSFKDFILGVGGKINVKESFIIAGLYVVGFAVPFIFNAKNITLRGVKPAEFAFLIIFMILAAWMQTTFEELAFRGFFIRWCCKNKVGYTKKALIVAGINAAIFALFHSLNPEVLSQEGYLIPIAILSYAIPGFMLFIADLHFGSLLPGCIMHLINNFLLYTVINAEISAVTNPTLLVDKTPRNGMATLIGTIILYLPITIYIVIDIIKRKKSAAR